MYSEYLDFVEKNFYKCFFEKGYLNENPVKITSRVDSSVTFVGAAISPMKKYVLSRTIGEKGRFLLQPSMRNRIIKNLQNSNYSMFGSYFNCMAALVEYQDLNRIVKDMFDYLIGYLKIPLSDIIIRINSKDKDKDLLESIKNIDDRIAREYNTFEEKYYIHKYGLDEEKIRGRNFNIGIRKKDTNQFLDIGNIIVMENDSEKIAVEAGVGNCTISMSYFGVDSTVASSRMGDVYEIDTIEKMKFADSIIVTSILMFEDIRKIKLGWYKYHFRKYRQAITFWKEKLNVSYETIAEYMRKFILLEFKTDIDLSNKDIINYIEYNFEK